MSPAIEWRTLGLITANYIAWLGVLAGYGWLPWPFIGLLGAVVVCFHGSLQHEVIHGHPSRWPILNHALVKMPLSLWLPFEIYRRSHIVHHATEVLTCPHRDPESAYVDRRCWRRLPVVLQCLLRFNQTLLGRVTIGPVIGISRFWWHSLGNIKADRDGERAIWLRHALAAGGLLFGLKMIFDVPPMAYICLFALPGLSLTLVRSFAEHQVASDHDHATTIVSSHSPLAFLFLYNNYHWWHHRYPRLPWYALSAKARAPCAQLPQGVRVYQGYGELVRAYGVRCRDVPWWNVN
jgi:fatty acid desaturase